MRAARPVHAVRQSLRPMCGLAAALALTWLPMGVLAQAAPAAPVPAVGSPAAPAVATAAPVAAAPHAPASASAAAPAASSASAAGGDNAAGEPTAPVDPTPAEAAQLFLQACVATRGDATRVVDQGLQAGLFPYAGDAPIAASLLDGQAGSAMVRMQGEAAEQIRYLLAVVPQVHCTVWVEAAHGPSVHLALLQALDGLRQTGGGELKPITERTVERSGAWRRQVQWRYRTPAGQPELRFGAVTTLGDMPGFQVLRLSLP